MEEIERDRRIANWGLQVEAACKKLRESQVLSAGEIQVNSRKEVAFYSKVTKLVEQAKGILQTLQNLYSSGTDSKNTARAIEQLFDNIGENIDTALDRHEQHLKDGREVAAPRRPKKRSRSDVDRTDTKRTKETSGEARPQDSFVDPPDNSYEPFWPDFSHLEGIATDLSDDGKPVPVNQTLETSSKKSRQLARYAAQLSPDAVRIKATYSHPFATALENLPENYPGWMLAVPKPEAPKPLDDTQLRYIDNAAALKDMAEHLSKVREFAADLEHSTRSFQGFTCLMQVSTRTCDYIVDTLKLRHLLGSHLASVFADPSKLKVLHGAVNDIQWLQKDFGLFVVNMFDTGQAAGVLGLPRGLAGLLQHYCDIKADKSFQKADWRQRPLSEAMMHYARSDTHFLLYIADCMRKELLNRHVPSTIATPINGPKGALGAALELSRQLCLLLYEKPQFSVSAYIKQYQKMRVDLTAEQLSAFAALSEWRDRTARTLDDGPAYVLPVKLWLRLSRKLPVTAAAVGDILKKHMSCQFVSEIVEVIKHSQEHKLEPAEELDRMASQAASEPGDDLDTEKSEPEDDSSGLDPEDVPPSPQPKSPSKCEQAKISPREAQSKSDAACMGKDLSSHYLVPPSIDKSCTGDPDARCGREEAKCKVSAGFDLSFIPVKKVAFKKKAAPRHAAAVTGSTKSLPDPSMQHTSTASDMKATEMACKREDCVDARESPVEADGGLHDKQTEARQVWDLGIGNGQETALQFKGKKAMGETGGSNTMAGLFGDGTAQRRRRPFGPLPELAGLVSEPVMKEETSGCEAVVRPQEQVDTSAAEDAVTDSHVDQRSQKERVGDTMAMLRSTGLAEDSDEGEPGEVEKSDQTMNKSNIAVEPGLTSLRERYRKDKRNAVPESHDRLGDLTKLTFGASRKQQKQTACKRQQTGLPLRDETFDYACLLDGSDKPPRLRGRQGPKDHGRGRNHRGRGSSSRNVFQDADFPHPQRSSHGRSGNRTSVFKRK